MSLFCPHLNTQIMLNNPKNDQEIDENSIFILKYLLSIFLIFILFLQRVIHEIFSVCFIV